MLGFMRIFVEVTITTTTAGGTLKYQIEITEIKHAGARSYAGNLITIKAIARMRWRRQWKPDPNMAQAGGKNQPEFQKQ